MRIKNCWRHLNNLRYSINRNNVNIIGIIAKIGIEPPKAQDVMAFEDDMVEDEQSVARQPPNKDIVNQNLKKAESEVLCI